MRPSERRRAIDNISRTAAQLDADLEQLVARIIDAQTGHPTATRTGAANTTPARPTVDTDDDPGPTIADPTGEAAAARADGRDPAARHLRDLDRAITAAERAMTRAARIAALYPRARRPDEHARRETVDAGEPGCQSCARLTGTHGGPRWEPVHRHHTMPDGSVIALCRWCYDWIRAVGNQPTRSELQAHHDGKRVRRPQPEPVTITMHEQPARLAAGSVEQPMRA